MAKRDSKLGVSVPAGEPKEKLRVSEWDVDPRNNRIYNISRTFERELGRLLEGEPKGNADSYTTFLKRMRLEGISVVRRLNYIRALQALKRANPGFLVGELSQQEIERFLDCVSCGSQSTFQIRFHCLRKFLRFVGKEDLVKGIKAPNKKEIKVRASDLLAREDVAKLLEACPNARTKAFVAMLYESGARIGEMLNIELKDLEFDGNGVLVEIHGKTGRRRIRLVESAQHLRTWVGEIRKGHPKTPYLWFAKDDQQPSQYAATLSFIKELARKAGLGKKVNPHLFRHSRASELAQKLREPQLRAFMGWTGASDMPQVYIHLSAQDMDKAILGLYGLGSCQRNDKEVSSPKVDEMAEFYAFWRRMKHLDGINL